MKLNPFRKKASGYFNQLKADYAVLTRELESLQSEALIESDGEATGMSDSLVKLHNDLKLLTEAHAKACQQEAAIKTELGGIPDQVREIRRCIQSGQASVAEIDLHEQMPEFIHVIARAAVSKDRAHGGNRYRYEIEIPAAAAEAAYAELEAEMEE
jgi:hypothetical protein